MIIALDPLMLRHLPIRETIRKVADIGYEYIELSQRNDFHPFFVHPRADADQVEEMKSALRETGVRIASFLPLYRWASPDEEERLAAVRYWRRAIEIAVELGCDTMNSELSGRPEQPERSEAQLWKSLEVILPILEKEGLKLNLEPHPDDFIEDGNAAVDFIRAINSPSVRYLYCTAHTFHMGGDIKGMLEYAAPVLAHIHVADTFDHRASSGRRYILNPPHTAARVHQHLDIGKGEVDWDLFFQTARDIQFDGIVTTAVFSTEERAEESAKYMLEQLTSRLSRSGKSGRRSDPASLAGTATKQRD
jgi:myo-inositol catabolism protein IolH